MSMITLSNIYGNPQTLPGLGGAEETTALEKASGGGEVSASVSVKITAFWVGMIALLVGARVLYEMAE